LQDALKDSTAPPDPAVWVPVVMNSIIIWFFDCGRNKRHAHNAGCNANDDSDPRC
jgi:hypothetical protein